MESAVDSDLQNKLYFKNMYRQWNNVGHFEDEFEFISLNFTRYEISNKSSHYKWKLRLKMKEKKKGKNLIWKEF